jgi:hypothetical protein
MNFLLCTTDGFSKVWYTNILPRIGETVRLTLNDKRVEGVVINIVHDYINNTTAVYIDPKNN